jgi:hypothetical protein
MMKYWMVLLALAAVQFAVGCGDAQPSHAGVYVDRIWTVPEHVTAGALVELHMDEIHDLSPGTGLLPWILPAQWATTAGDLYSVSPQGEWWVPMEEQAGGLNVESAEMAMWLAPDTPQDVSVTVSQYGRPLTVVITVHPAE